MELIKGAWAGLDNTGRIVLIVCVTVAIIAGLYFGVDWAGLLQ